MRAPLQAKNDSNAVKTDVARTVVQERFFADNRPDAAAQHQLAKMMNSSPRVMQQRALSDAIHNSPRMVAQRHQMNPLFGGAVKPQGGGAMPAEASPAQLEEKPNHTGVPDQLMSGIESLSGMSMDHVKVHYNSDRPAQLNAHAYAQGSEIHVAPGQERHLPHEAWHVVQQAQGRVKPTLQMKAGVPVNDDAHLEHEADVMGAKALSVGLIQAKSESGFRLPDPSPSGGSGGTLQRFGNTAEPLAGTLDAIHAGAPTVDAKLLAIEHSADPALWYGTQAAVDEEVEITASATYLAKHKREWRAELQTRAAGQAATQQTFEKFQRGMNDMTPGENPNEAPWFMNPAYGYRVNGGREVALQQIATARDNPSADDPQQLFGQTYQRDTMYISDSANLAANHTAQFDAAANAATVAGWADHVLLLTAGAAQVRLRVTGAVGPDPVVTIGGTALASPNSPPWFPPSGTAINLRRNAGAALEVLDAGGAVHSTVAAGTWNGRVQSWAYFNAWTIPNDNLGRPVPGPLADRGRNRADAPVLLNNGTYDTVGARRDAPGERSTRRTLGPNRSGVNLHEVGMEIQVAPYRRLGGDAIFAEAKHPAPGAYQNQLQPRGAVDTNNADWYYDQANAMPNRFVGGRSNSTLRYMAAATMLFHRGTLTLGECQDIVAFVISDMVVSGEHSMPECMTSVVMAAAGSEPWNATGVNLVAPTATLKAWLRLIDAGTRQQMLADTQAHLRILLADPAHDRKLLKIFAIIDKQLYNQLNGG